jgi:hypothetical protein
VSIAMLAREVEDKESGKHLYLNHLLVELVAVPPNHRYGLTSAMILLFEHPTSSRVRERPIKGTAGS